MVRASTTLLGGRGATQWPARYGARWTSRLRNSREERARDPCRKRRKQKPKHVSTRHAVAYPARKIIEKISHHLLRNGDRSVRSIQLRARICKHVESTVVTGHGGMPAS